MGDVDEVLYSEGAGAATWAVVGLSLTAAAIAGSTWLRYLTRPEAGPAAPPGGALPSALAMLIALVVGLIGIDTLIRRKIVLTETSLRVGRESVPLNRLSFPVLAGEYAPESIRNSSFTRNALPSGCRALGDLPSAVLGQGVLMVTSSKPREILVLYSWRPQVLAHFLSRALEARGDDGAAANDDL